MVRMFKGRSKDRLGWIEYWELTGWDPETGIPKKEGLAELDLAWLI
jgi:aldehyde:ferredoxin oxidoreductase